MKQKTIKAQPKLRVGERVTKIRSLAHTNDAIPLVDIKQSLADRSPTVRTATVDIVKEKSLREVEKNVRLLLLDMNRNVRHSAVECLGSLHEGERIEATWLYPLLSDPFYLVRIETLESLGRIEDERALPQIAAKLSDEHPLVRSYAARLLADLHGAQYFENLAERARVEHDDVARVGLAYALFELGDAEQLSTLLRLLVADDYHVRCASANSLAAVALTPAQLDTVLDALSNAARHSLAVADKTTMERVEKEIRTRA